jgi:tetratricopeptide (TPR) repeat protein
MVYLPREKQQIPVALIDGQTTVCRLNLKGGSEALAALEYRRDAWLQRVYENVRRARERGKDLSKALSQSLQAAEEMAREGLKNLDGELSDLKQEHDELKQLVRETKLAAARLDLTEGEQRLDELREKRDKLNEFVQGLVKAIKEGEENKQVNQLIGQARLLEARADFSQAIALYEKALQVRPNHANVPEHLAALKQGWALKNDKQHPAARTFVYETWPNLDIDSLKKNLEAARQHFEALKGVGDRLTAEKMRQVDEVHMANLKKELDRLKQKDSEDNRNRAKAIAPVAAAVIQLHNEITAFVGPRKE